jgi:hypothetical protein
VRTITQRELLNDSARILREAETGEVFATSTDEDLVGELRSVGSREFRDPWDDD